MNVYIAESKIHGRGVFAYEEIEEGHWQYVYGELKKDVRFARVVNMAAPGGPGPDVVVGAARWKDYCFEWDGKSIFDPYAPWRFVNHSRDPNCEVEWEIDGNVVLMITAIRDIEPNEELTIDYGYDPSQD